MMFRRVLICLLALGLLAPVSALAEQTPLAYDDVFLLEWVSDPQPDPAGEHIVFVRHWMDRMADRARSSLW
ncbi:MAG: hypothetical protein ACOCVP_04555 [Wenzhouxiangella sp.]